MHGSIQDRLEQLLVARGTGVIAAQAAQHLSACEECSSELASFQSQADLLKRLKSPAEIEPAPGFYARVLGCIEERTKDSIWSVFVYSPFAKRVVYASLTMAVMLGTYVVTEENRDGDFRSPGLVAQDLHDDAVVEGNQAQQRDRVLENFAAHPLLASAKESLR